MSARIDRGTGDVEFPFQGVEREPAEGKTINLLKSTPLFPKVETTLFNYLDQKFPDRVPSEGMSEFQAIVELAKVWGRREVLDHLRSLLQETD